MSAKAALSPAKSVRKDCQNCGATFSSAVHSARYCAVCRDPVKGGLLSKFRPSPKKGPFDCERCGSEYFTRHSGQRFCTKACTFESLRDRATPARQERVDEHKRQKLARRAARRAACIAAAEIRRIADRIERDRALTRKCRECNKTFIARSKIGAFCTPHCADKSHSRIAHRRRRAKVSGVRVEAVNPSIVFQRDKWKCQLCGCKVLRSKRGECDPRSPELDHIIPLSQGGEHSYRNTQCACRACNQAKGARELGQLRLFG